MAVGFLTWKIFYIYRVHFENSNKKQQRNKYHEIKSFLHNDFQCTGHLVFGKVVGL